MAVIKTKTGFSLYFPNIPGCVTAFKNLKDMKKQAEECLILHLEGMIEDGLELPASYSLLDYVVDNQNKKYEDVSLYL